MDFPHKDPLEVLRLCQRIERAAGRAAPGSRPRNAPRTLDIDLLCGEGIVLDTPELVLPHPRMAKRRFVLEPLASIAPGLRPLPDGTTVAEMLAALPPGEVLRSLTDAVAWEASTI